MVSKIRKNAYCLLFSAAFGFCNSYVHMLTYGLFSDNWDKLILLVNTLVVTGVSYLCLTRIVFSQAEPGRTFVFEKDETRKTISDRKYFLLTALVIFLLWLPVFLAYYPGLFAYDVSRQIKEKIIGYSTKHPLLHTLYLQFFYYFIGNDVFKSYNKGIAAATLIQMAVFALMLSFAHLYLRRISIQKKWRVLLIGSTGILPFFSMLAIAMTKDTFFTGWFVIFFTILCYQERFPGFIEQHKIYRALYIVSITGTILFRNTGIYPVVALALALLVEMATYRKKCSIVFCHCLSTGHWCCYIFCLAVWHEGRIGIEKRNVKYPLPATCMYVS